MNNIDIPWSQWCDRTRMDRVLARRDPVHTAHVGLGRVPGVVEVFDDGIVRLRSQSATNFYSEGLLGPAEIAAFRRQRRSTIHELLKHKFEGAAA